MKSGGAPFLVVMWLPARKINNLAQRRKARQVEPFTNSKLEIRNSKQFQMGKDYKFLNGPVSDFVIEI